jgi:dUTP pyrophosphatase
MPQPIRVAIQADSPACIPEYATEWAAGMDLKANEACKLAPGERKGVATGIRLEIPPGHEGQVRPRSGLALKSGLTVANAPGTIDSDYRGEVKVILVNLGQEEVSIEMGDRIAQLIVAPVSRVEWDVTESLQPTLRGEGGFGSTGIRE